MVNTAGHWHALIGCSDHQRRPVARSYWLLLPTLQASSTLLLAVMATTPDQWRVLILLPPAVAAAETEATVTVTTATETAGEPEDNILNLHKKDWARKDELREKKRQAPRATSSKGADVPVAASTSGAAPDQASGAPAPAVAGAEAQASGA